MKALKNQDRMAYLDKHLDRINPLIKNFFTAQEHEAIVFMAHLIFLSQIAPPPMRKSFIHMLADFTDAAIQNGLLSVAKE